MHKNHKRAWCLRNQRLHLKVLLLFRILLISRFICFLKLAKRNWFSTYLVLGFQAFVLLCNEVFCFHFLLCISSQSIESKAKVVSFVLTFFGFGRVSAKGELNKLCSMRHWKPPVYEWEDEGPCHMPV